MRRLSKQQQLSVIRLLVEGNSLRTISRLTGIHRDTCNRLAKSFGIGCDKLLLREMKDLELRHLQVDEMWTYVQRKSRFSKSSEHDEPTQEEIEKCIGRYFIFLALDQDTRLVPCFRVGRRTEGTTWDFIQDLYECLKLRNHQFAKSPTFIEGRLAPDIQISTDGYSAYPAAIKSIFGTAAIHGQIVKNIAEAKKKKSLSIKKRCHSPLVDPATISTSLVERNNLTLRTYMRRLVRRTLGFSKKLSYLQAATALHLAHYNFCWRHGTLKTSPATAAGITKGVWSLERLFDEVGQV